MSTMGEGRPFGMLSDVYNTFLHRALDAEPDTRSNDGKEAVGHQKSHFDACLFTACSKNTYLRYLFEI